MKIFFPLVLLVEKVCAIWPISAPSDKAFLTFDRMYLVVVLIEETIVFWQLSTDEDLIDEGRNTGIFGIFLDFQDGSRGWNVPMS